MDALDSIDVRIEREDVVLHAYLIDVIGNKSRV